MNAQTVKAIVIAVVAGVLVMVIYDRIKGNV
jgi:hypothetical protein